MRLIGLGLFSRFDFVSGRLVRGLSVRSSCKQKYKENVIFAGDLSHVKAV